MRATHLLKLSVLCAVIMLSSAYHFRPYIISGWPIMIRDEDQVPIPDDVYISKMSDTIQNGFHPRWDIFQNELRN
ncbi:hypothetical protein LOAG_16653 [Loa loa]|uniref:Uncharacterized protein n=1 Tax=Loa loa TaxID=7209 RepID=A0A1S0ULG4_LOALO|nr:hypothetical protein LOAG_16653 [Loa loa]EJD76419.1 hypothetical protein LOAG_16653 [Loa loa]